MSWINERLACFDTETTGVSVENDRIVSACLAFVGGGQTEDIHSWLCAVDVPAEATKIHGITTEHAKTHGREPAEVVEDICALVVNCFDRSIPLVGFNISFDLSILMAEAARHGIFMGLDLPDVIDVFVLDKHFDRYRKGSRKLPDVARHYGVKVLESHEAGADALAAGRVLWRMAQKYDEIANNSPDYLHKKQVTWAREQAEHFHEYRMEQGSLLAALEEAVALIQETQATPEMEWEPLVTEKITSYQKIINKAKAARDDKETTIDGAWPIRGV